jgi:hypothetical protein
MPFNRLFNKTERRYFTGSSKEGMASLASAFWRSKGFNIDFSSPFQLHAEHLQTTWGLRRAVDLWISDANGSVAVDINFSATLGDGEAALGVIGAVIWLPAVAVVGAVSYSEYQKDAYDLIGEFWRYLGAEAHGETSTGARCKSCGASIPPDSKFCKQCGKRVED